MRFFVEALIILALVACGQSSNQQREAVQTNDPNTEDTNSASTDLPDQNTVNTPDVNFVVDSNNDGLWLQVDSNHQVFAKEINDNSFAGAVLLLHKQGFNNKEWETYTQTISSTGVAVLALDLSNGGFALGSVNKTVEKYGFSNDFSLLTQEVEAAVNYAYKKYSKVILIGAEYSAALSVYLVNKILADRVQGLATLSLSQQKSINGSDTQSLAQSITMPFFLVTSPEEKTEFVEVTRGYLNNKNVASKTHHTGGIGTLMLEQDEVLETFTDYIKSVFRISSFCDGEVFGFCN